MKMDGGEKRSWGSCEPSCDYTQGESPTISVSFIHPLIEYQNSSPSWFGRKHHSFCLIILLVDPGISIIAHVHFFFFFVLFYICAFPCSLCSLWADSCVANVLSTDVVVYGEIYSPPRSPCCEAVYIRLLSCARPEVICLLYNSSSGIWLFPSPSFKDAPQMTHSLSPRTGNVPHFHTYLLWCCHVWDGQRRLKGNFLLHVLVYSVYNMLFVLV